MPRGNPFFSLKDAAISTRSLSLRVRREGNLVGGHAEVMNHDLATGAAQLLEAPRHVWAFAQDDVHLAKHLGVPSQPGAAPW
jgi:hypothetical protein